MSTKTKATLTTTTATSASESTQEDGASTAMIEGKVTTDPAAVPPPAEQTTVPPPAEHDPSLASDSNDMLSRLRIPQDFSSKSSTKKLVTTIPIRTPKKNEFVRVHRTMVAMLLWTLMDEQLVYVVNNDIAESLPGVMVKKELVATITRQGTLFLWPLRVPGEHGRTDNWLTSAKEAAGHAVHAWVRVQANMDLGAFEIYEAMGAIPDPEWPQLSMDEIVRIAVKGRVIDSLDHPVLQKLRGEV